MFVCSCYLVIWIGVVFMGLLSGIGCCVLRSSSFCLIHIIRILVFELSYWLLIHFCVAHWSCVTMFGLLFIVAHGFCFLLLRFVVFIAIHFGLLIREGLVSLCCLLCLFARVTWLSGLVLSLWVC